MTPLNPDKPIIDHLNQVLGLYQQSLTKKVYSEENDDDDLLMNVFGLTPKMKRENRQYWGRELGMCWQLLVVEIFKNLHPEYQQALRIDLDEPCDLLAGKYAIDTKYRVGSGDSGTLKKFRAYGQLLRNQGYEPVFLVLRNDNLPAALRAFQRGTWNVCIGDEAFQFIQTQTGFDLRNFLTQASGQFRVER